MRTYQISVSVCAIVACLVTISGCGTQRQPAATDRDEANEFYQPRMASGYYPHQHKGEPTIVAISPMTRVSPDMTGSKLSLRTSGGDSIYIKTTKEGRISSIEIINKDKEEQSLMFSDGIVNGIFYGNLSVTKHKLPEMGFNLYVEEGSARLIAPMEPNTHGHQRWGPVEE